MKKRRRWQSLLGIAVVLTAAVIAAGFLVPGEMMIPVKGATAADWNRNSFWFRPWGKSGVHRGIDIFSPEGREVVAATTGVVVSTDTTPDGGNIVAVLGPRWRVHYYAHLKEIKTRLATVVSKGEVIGTVGSTGNAAGKPPHLHYAVISQLPYVWLYRPEKFGFDRMFYLNPHELLTQRKER